MYLAQEDFFIADLETADTENTIQENETIENLEPSPDVSVHRWASYVIQNWHLETVIILDHRVPSWI